MRWFISLPFSINLKDVLQIFGLNVYKIPKIDQVTFFCLLQHNVYCGRGQNHQAYKHSFHDETSHGSKASSMLFSSATQRILLHKVLKRNFDTNHKQRRPLVLWRPETSDQWKQKAEEAIRKIKVPKTFPLEKTSTLRWCGYKVKEKKVCITLKTFWLREDLTVIAAAIKHQFVILLCTKCAFHPSTYIILTFTFEFYSWSTFCFKFSGYNL